MVAKLSFPPYYITQAFSSFVYAPRKRNLENERRRTQLDLNPSFSYFSVYSFIQMGETKLKDFRLKKVDKFANHVIEIYLISARWFDLG